jgi:starch phosphorylase
VFAPLVSNLVDHDPFLVMADYADYIRCQAEVDRTWHNRNTWARMSILNSARSGKFSSDRSIAEYCDEIWNVQPVTIKGK